MNQRTTFITNDYWMRKGGVLDPADQKCLDEAGPNAQLLNLREVAALFEKEKPPEGDNEAADQKMNQLQQLAASAGRIEKHLKAVVEDLLDESKAQFVRDIRCKKHRSWRSVAASCAEEWGTQWQPPSNQIAGVALCERAAEILGEDPHTLPWNDI